MIVNKQGTPQEKTNNQPKKKKKKNYGRLVGSSSSQFPNPFPIKKSNCCLNCSKGLGRGGKRATRRNTGCPPLHCGPQGSAQAGEMTRLVKIYVHLEIDFWKSNQGEDHIDRNVPECRMLGLCPSYRHDVQRGHVSWSSLRGQLRMPTHHSEPSFLAHIFFATLLLLLDVWGLQSCTELHASKPHTPPEGKVPPPHTAPNHVPSKATSHGKGSEPWFPQASDIHEQNGGSKPSCPSDPSKPIKDNW